MNAGRLALAAYIAAAIVAVVPVACTRHADLRDEPDASELEGDPILDAGPLPALDSGLASLPACATRPSGECAKGGDFPCNFSEWAVAVARSCQTSTGCVTNGRVEISMSGDGCVSAIGMDQPNDAIVACLVAGLGALKCPCSESKVAYFFGLGNDGHCP